MATIEQLERRLNALLSTKQCATCATRAATCPECGHPVGYTELDAARARQALIAELDRQHQRMARLGQTDSPDG